MKRFSFHSDTTLRVALVVFIGGVMGLVLMYFSVSPFGNKDILACTQEARVCPDGSTTTRTGPNCTFASCNRSVLPNHPGITDEPFLVPPTDTKTTPIKKGVLCTQEVQLCSDGSFVARTGSRCEFALCPSTLELDTDR